MKTVVTGGAGFIGSHLAEVLLQREASVTVVDDLSTGSIDNIRDLKNRPGFSYVIDSVMNRSLMAAVPAPHVCDIWRQTSTRAHPARDDKG